MTRKIDTHAHWANAVVWLLAKKKICFDAWELRGMRQSSSRSQAPTKPFKKQRRIRGVVRKHPGRS